MIFERYTFALLPARKINMDSDNVVKLTTGQFINSGVNEGLKIVWDINLAIFGMLLGIGGQ